jgi:hypothetical protein
MFRTVVYFIYEKNNLNPKRKSDLVPFLPLCSIYLKKVAKIKLLFNLRVSIYTKSSITWCFSRILKQLEPDLGLNFKR